MPDATASPAPEPAAAASPIKLPGGNTLSRDRHPTLNTSLAGLKALGGSDWPEFNRALLNATVAVFPPQDPDAVSPHVAATSAALAAFKPADEIEAMIGAQVVALHHVSMECLRRAMVSGQIPEVASKLRKDGANLARAMTDMLVALDRKRGTGVQVVRVERVVVHEGGQAIVGNVKGGDTVAVVTKPAAISQDPTGIALDDVIGGRQPELVGREGV
jgi:hypothetical protein